MSNRTTLVEGIVGTSRSTMQQFSYGLNYDDFLLPKTVAWPTCTSHGCATSNGLGSVTFGRSAGYLTSVDGFADLTYHPTGMVETVVHESSPSATDTYSATSGLARPSEITFSIVWAMSKQRRMPEGGHAAIVALSGFRGKDEG